MLAPTDPWPRNLQWEPRSWLEGKPRAELAVGEGASWGASLGAGGRAEVWPGGPGTEGEQVLGCSKPSPYSSMISFDSDHGWGRGGVAVTPILRGSLVKGGGFPSAMALGSDSQEPSGMV